MKRSIYKNKTLLIILCFAVLIVITITSILIIYTKRIPYNFVSKYLDTRYNMTCENVEESIIIQKSMFDKSAINAGYKFADFEWDIKSLTESKTKFRLLDKDIHNIIKIDDITCVKASVCVEVEVNIVEKVVYKMDAVFDFKLKKVGWNKYMIAYIKELDREVKAISSSISEKPVYEHSHEH